MAYTINKTDGSIVTTINDGTIDNSTSITLLGKNYQGYGEIIAENFIKLLENSASSTVPSGPITGELWYDKSTSNLKVFDGSNFNIINSVRSQTSAPTTSLQNGVFWYDTVNSLLKIYVSGTGFISLGPFTIQDDDAFASATSTALASSESIKAYVDNQIVALNAMPIFDDASNSQSVNIPDGILFRGGSSLTSSVNLDSSNNEYSVTFALDSDIYVNSIQSADSTKVRINDILETNSIVSNGSITGTSISISGTNNTFGSINIDGNVITSTDSSVISFGSHQLSGVSDPTQPSDAATKSYVDAQVSSLSAVSITQGDTNVTVADSGSGTVTTTVDGGVKILSNATNTTVSQPLVVASDSGITVGADSDVTLTQSGANFTLKNTTEDGNILINVNDGGVDTTAITVDGATASVSITNNLTVTGNLQVDGTTVTVNSTNTTIEDALLVLNTGMSATNTYDAGLIVERGSATNVGFIWDESTDEFACVNTTETGNTAGNVVISSYADLQVANLTGVSSSAQYADLAEKYISDAEYEEGTVVMFGGEKEITEAKGYATTKVAGVISSNPAYLMNSEGEGQPVALMGKVPVKVIGKVAKGDMMVTSHNSGHAEATNEFIGGAIIGKALESKTDEGSGIIQVVIGLK